MVYHRMVQIGRVVMMSDGPYQGKLATIVEVIDGNRALIDGPCSGVPRHPATFRQMHLTALGLPIRHGARTSTVKRSWTSEKVQEKFDDTRWAKKIKLRQLRANLSDFDRFKLMKAKQMRNRIIRSEVNKLKKTARNAGPKATKKVRKRPKK